MADNSSENAPIGFKAPALKGAEVRKVAVGVGKAVPKAVAQVVEEAVAVRNASLQPIVRKATVRFAPAAGSEPGPGGGGGGPGPAASAPAPIGAPALVVSELEEKDKTEKAEADAEEAAVEVKAIKASLSGKRGAKAIPLPADAPLVSEFTTDLKKRIYGSDPVVAKPAAAEGYRPITSASFPDFMLQTYRQFSPYLQRVLKEGKEAAAVPKPLDKDACKKRDPNKVETFYYQNFVRDFLSRGTPYRGLLVYHGLGTGKTCTSIAAAEALYWGGKKTIFVLTPATLSNNYRKDLGKCGYFPLRQNNFWAFLKLTIPGSTTEPTFIWLTQAMGLPPALVTAQGGGWIPNPDKPTNWDSLAPDVKEAIRAQQQAHLNFRFKFIHYNGVTPTILSQLAASGVAEGKSMFDDAVVVIDEIHNLVRTINGTQIGGQPMSQIIQTVEPREPTWSTPLGRERPGFRYPRGYTLYRLLQNAVGAKIVALSATPMINYAQELAILMNLIGGEQRMVEISLRSADRSPSTTSRIDAWARERPDIDFYSIEAAPDKSTVLNVTPVPFGFSKVVREDYSSRGFVRVGGAAAVDVKESRERNMDRWAVSLLKDLEAKGLLRGVGVEAEAAVTTARTAGPGTPIASTAFKLHTFPMLPEDAKEFVANFVDRNTLKIINARVLQARATGLISFYRGGSEELMPRTGRNEIVEVPMSEYMFKEYSVARLAELEMEGPTQADEGGGGGAGKARKGMTAAEVDLYTQATKSQQTGFLALSRAACNWVFPEEVPRPKVSVKDQVKLLGAEQNKLIDADLAEDVDVEMDVAEAPSRLAELQKKLAMGYGMALVDAGGVGSAVDIQRAEEVVGTEAEWRAALEKEIATAPAPDSAPAPGADDAVLPDAPPAEAPAPLDATLAGILGTLMSGLEGTPEKADAYLNKGLPTYSPKYATILANIRQSPGPALVYSQFKTLEGLGIFAAVLRASDEKFLPLDIQKGADGQWAIPDALMVPGPKYILYTGDQELDKRRLLLQLYNADLGSLPQKLKEQCTALLASAEDNRDGRVCRVFMITQSGAEGISLFNTRQVHIMEPYWNNVRLQQVIGRAIRLCSHMNLPWDDRVVDVFTYLSVFSPQQKAEGSKTLMMMDKAMTTDQMIFDIATKKQKLADGLFEIAQTAAADCKIHFHEHGAATQCFEFAKGARPLFMYHPDWHKDLQASVRATTGA